MTLKSLHSLFEQHPEMRGVLEDVNVRHIVIGPDGRFEYSKLGRHRLASSNIPEDLRQQIHVHASNATPVGDWMVRSFSGAFGHTLLLERLPTPVLDRLPQPVLTHLKRVVRREGVGLILGNPGASKTTILLWLAHQWTEESLIFISENPPAERPASHIFHVFPPSSAEQRRDLERLVRLNAAVFWDRATPSDLVTLLTFPGGKRRWASIDGQPSDLPATMRAMASAGIPTRLDAVLFVSSSVVGRPEIQNLAVREDGRWDEVYLTVDSILPFLNFETRPLESAADPVAVPQDEKRSLSEASSEEIPETAETGLQERSSMAGIRKRPRQPTTDFDNPLTIPVPEDEDLSLDQPSETADPDQRTGLISAADLITFAPRREVQDSGEIEVPAFKQPQNLPEVTRQYSEAVHKGQTANADADFLSRLLPTLQKDHGTGPAQQVNLEDLRITRVEDVDDMVLEHTRAIRDAYVPTKRNHDYDDDESDVEEHDLAGVMSDQQLDEISGIISEDDVATSVASAAQYAAVTWKSATDQGAPNSQSLAPDRDTNPSVVSPALPTFEDRTEEVSRDRMRQIRERLQRKDGT